MTTALLVSSAGLIGAGWAGDYLPRHLILRVGAWLLLVTILAIWSLIASGTRALGPAVGRITIVSGFAPLAASAMMEWTGMLAAPAVGSGSI